MVFTVPLLTMVLLVGMTGRCRAPSSGPSGSGVAVEQSPGQHPNRILSPTHFNTNSPIRDYSRLIGLKLTSSTANQSLDDLERAISELRPTDSHQAMENNKAIVVPGNHHLYQGADTKYYLHRNFMPQYAKLLMLLAASAYEDDIGKRNSLIAE